MLVVGISVLVIALFGNMFAEDAPAQETKAEPQLCRGHYHSEEDAKEQLAKFARSYSSLDEWKARAKNIREGILRGAELVPMLKKPRSSPLFTAGASTKATRLRMLRLKAFPVFL
jgi:hypothetical protein